MNANLDDNKNRVERVIYPVSCCHPLGAYLWGLLFVIVGSALFLHQLGLVPIAWLGFLWPLILLGFGIACLAWAINNRRKSFS